MKKALFAVLITLSALPAFGQWNPNPNPNPYPRYCQVAAVDQYNRVIARFQGQTDPRGMCRNALRQCNYEVRRRGWWGVRCTQLRTQW